MTTKTQEKYEIRNKSGDMDCLINFDDLIEALKEQEEELRAEYKEDGDDFSFNQSPQKNVHREEVAPQRSGLMQTASEDKTPNPSFEEKSKGEIPLANVVTGKGEGVCICSLNLRNSICSECLSYLKEEMVVGK